MDLNPTLQHKNGVESIQLEIIDATSRNWFTI